MKHDERDFETVVRNIVRAEEDVDRVLKAAKLERRERSSLWEGTLFSEIIFGLVIVIGLGGLFTLMILSIVL